MSAPSHNPPGFGSRLMTAFKRLMILGVVLGLAGVTVFLLSQINARTFTLEVREAKLVVLKGKSLPMGADPWRPADPALVDAYAPIDLKGTQPYGVLNTKYAERDELDRALYTVLEGLARPRINSDDPRELEDGLYYLRRADHLSGLTDEQKISLKQMKADVAFYSARVKLEEAQKLTEEAITQLLFATQSPNRHQREANQMLLAVQPESKAMIEAMRKAVHSLSEPAALGGQPGVEQPHATTVIGVPVAAPPLPIPTTPTAAVPAVVPPGSQQQ